MVDVLLATNNPKKLVELERTIAQASIDNLTVLTLDDVPEYDPPVENGKTFVDNALIKARAGVENTGLACISDDSGICVDALSGMPGVFSARWSGTREGITLEEKDRLNRELLLAQVGDVKPGARTAHYVCVCALVLPDGTQHVVEGLWSGELAVGSQGSGGFGYDPIFLPEGFDGKTAAELPANEKERHSHRTKALAQLVPYLRQLAQGTLGNASPDSDAAHE